MTPAQVVFGLAVGLPVAIYSFILVVARTSESDEGLGVLLLALLAVVVMFFSFLLLAGLGLILARPSSIIWRIVKNAGLVILSLMTISWALGFLTQEGIGFLVAGLILLALAFAMLAALLLDLIRLVRRYTHEARLR